MRQVLTFLFALLSVAYLLGQDCPSNVITLNTQEEIDNFAVNYPECTEIPGNVTIGSNSFAGVTLYNLNGLSQIASIGGFLRIKNTIELNDLSGLNNLTAVGGNLSIAGNGDLLSLTGLENLLSVNGNVTIDRNSYLYDLNGLVGLRDIGSNLSITENYYHLDDFTGLNGLETVGGDLSIINSSEVTNLSGFDNLYSVGGTVNITENDNLSNIDGFDNVTQGNINISNNRELSNIDILNNITELDGSITIQNNEYYLFDSISGFDNITKLDSLIIGQNDNLIHLSGFNNVLEGHLMIYGNDNLSDMSIFNNVINLDGSIIITGNGQLTALNSFNNLTTISDDLYLQYNVALTDISPFNDLTAVRKLTIKGGNFEDMSAFSNLSEAEEVYFSGNNFISFDGLQNIDTLTTLEIEYCDSLANLNGLNNLHHIRDRFLIRSSENLADISALGNLRYVGGGFLLQITKQLTSLQGLGNLQEVGGSLYVTNHDALTNMMGLSGLTTVGGDLLISRNDVMTDFVGLDELRVVRGGLQIRFCPFANNLSGLEDIDSIGGLWIGYNDNMTNLTGMDAVLNGYIFIDNNPSLINLNTTESLNIDEVSEIRINSNAALNNLEGLEQITSVVGDVQINSNSNLISLEGLGQVTHLDRDVIISSNENLSSLNGLNNVNFIRQLFVTNNPKLTDFTGLNNLNYTFNMTVTGNDTLSNMNGLDNLDSISIKLKVEENPNLNDFSGLEDLNFTRNLDINDNASLTSLTGLDNINPSGIINCQIINNDNLYDCGIEPICNYLAGSMGNVSISNNASGCNGVTQTLYTCSGLARILSQTFYDANQNKIQDGQEPYYTDASLLIEPQNTYFSPNDDYVFWLDAGNYTVSYNQVANPDWQLTTDSASYFVQLADNQSETILFGVYPAQEISEIKTFITSPPARCNESITFSLTAKNVGTTVASGTMWIQIDDNITSIMPENMPDTITDSAFYGWYFTDLYPSQSITQHITLGIPGPPDFPVGDFLYFLAFTDYDDVNGAHTSEGFRYDTEVRCSFDPNDKLVNPTRYHYETLLDEDLIYTIRFQNTGNDVAYDVRILDTLDTNLDWSTFRVLGSSHSEVLNTSLSDEGVITFDFKDIFLPDSTSNLEGSNGHVTYMISALDGIISFK